MKCGPDKYKFRCIKGSHQRVSSVNYNIPVDEKMITTVTANEGDFICFFDTLMHGGGRSSKKRGEAHFADALFKGVFDPKQPQEVPTDISYQMSMRHSGVRSLRAYIDTPKVLPFRNRSKGQEQDEQFKKYLEDGKNIKELEGLLGVARAGYFNLLMGIPLPRPKRMTAKYESKPSAKRSK